MPEFRREPIQPLQGEAARKLSLGASLKIRLANVCRDVSVALAPPKRLVALVASEARSVGLVVPKQAGLELAKPTRRRTVKYDYSTLSANRLAVRISKST